MKIYSVSELESLYKSQGKLSIIERAILDVAMWARALKANYHGYVKYWLNVAYDADKSELIAYIAHGKQSKFKLDIDRSYWGGYALIPCYE